MTRKIIIVGGGIAGLTLGVLLRRGGIPVDLFEAGRYPRHRVCGEYMSGRGARLLGALGLSSPLPSIESQTVRFLVEGRRSQRLTLPEPALCVSRFDLDKALADEFLSAGGNLMVGQRWQQPFDREGVVRATGRRLHPSEGGFVGVKAHVSGLQLDAGLEMHFTRGGYAGICPLPNGMANVCGLFERAGFKAPRGQAKAAFDPVLGNRLAEGEIEQGSFCSVAGVVTGIEAGVEGEFSVGDSLGVIPPLTGNGMSLAMESAHLALPFLQNYCAGAGKWHENSQRFSQRCKRAFGWRLRFSSFLQTALLRPKTASLVLSCLQAGPGLLPAVFRLTR